jgi:KamA family protein
MQVTPHYLSLIDDDDPHDPLKKIVTPRNAELVKFGVADIMGEHEDYKVRGLQHRYPETALLLVNNFCAGYCRFCFRKRIFNPLNIEDERISDLMSAIEYVRDHPEICNVLLSGGDPLVSSVKKLASIFRLLEEIPHVKYVRIGTKVPAFLPQRIYEDEELLDLFKNFNKAKPLFVVGHFDHANEISPETGLAVRALQGIGVNTLAHMVLLNNVNDNAGAIKALLDKMNQFKITPYYIFHAMPITGTEHFQVPMQHGIDVIREACRNLSGLSKQFKYIIPHYIGKTELLGYDSNYFYLRQHQARDHENVGRMFKLPFSENRTWFTEDEIISI